jgi:hypothetical protein
VTGLGSHRVIDPVGRNVLADRDPILLAQRVAQIEGAMLVLDHHLVPALAAVEQPMQQCRTSTGDAARLVPVILSVVVFEHVPDLQKGVPTHIGGVLIVDTDLPLLYWEGLLNRLGWI